MSEKRRTHIPIILPDNALRIFSQQLERKQRAQVPFDPERTVSHEQWEAMTQSYTELRIAVVNKKSIPEVLLFPLSDIPRAVALFAPQDVKKAFLTPELGKHLWDTVTELEARLPMQLAMFLQLAATVKIAFPGQFGTLPHTNDAINQIVNNSFMMQQRIDGYKKVYDEAPLIQNVCILFPHDTASYVQDAEWRAMYLHIMSTGQISDVPSIRAVAALKLIRPDLYNKQTIFLKDSDWHTIREQVAWNVHFNGWDDVATQVFYAALIAAPQTEITATGAIHVGYTVPTTSKIALPSIRNF